MRVLAERNEQGSQAYDAAVHLYHNRRYTNEAVAYQRQAHLNVEAQGLGAFGSFVAKAPAQLLSGAADMGQDSNSTKQGSLSSMPT